MVRFFVKRPIAVLMCFLSFAIAGLVLLNKIPVSLLPDIDVPRIIIRVNYYNTPASAMEENIVRPIRESMSTIRHLKSITSLSSNHTGFITLDFDYGTHMNLSYIEVNERLERLNDGLPRDMERPTIMRVNTSDVPILRIQIIPKDTLNFAAVSALCQKVLKRRLEQIEGVSLVDISGYKSSIVSVCPDQELLNAYHVSADKIVQAVRKANVDIGGLSLKNGQYRYFVKITNALQSTEELSELPIQVGEGQIIPLKELAQVKLEQEVPTGYHLYNGNQGIVITVEKQAASRMNELVPKLKETISQFKVDYPALGFEVTQDQSFLLDAGISNLYQDIIYGGILTVALLFMFLGNWEAPLLMSVNIPLSLVITFVLFYFLHVSFNIISLSGLALGIGMLIDNSIVVVDSITRKRSEGLDPLESSHEGVNEVAVPVISQVLTTVAVYAPLVILSGIAGDLVYDQSIGLTISLCVSLFVAFILTPTLYTLLLKRRAGNFKEDTIFYKWVSHGYHLMISHIFKHKLPYFLVTVSLMSLGPFLGAKLKVASLPEIEKTEGLFKINWNDEVDAIENRRRVESIIRRIRPVCEVTEAEVGIKQFLFQSEDNSIQKSQIYYSCSSESKKRMVDSSIVNYLQSNFQAASYKVIDAPNAFTALFDRSNPLLEVRFKSINSRTENDMRDKLSKIFGHLPDKHFDLGVNMITQPFVSLNINYDRMMLYHVEREDVMAVVEREFGNFTISNIKQLGDQNVIILKESEGAINQKLNAPVVNHLGISYPLSEFISVNERVGPKYISADKGGIYKSIAYNSFLTNPDATCDSIAKLSAAEGLSVNFYGDYFEDKNQIKRLGLIFFIVLVSLYIILAIQYESLALPLIVMLTIPLGVTGGLFLLWITGGTLNVMSAIGFIVILGLVVDDPILKVETLNRLYKNSNKVELLSDESKIEAMVHAAGDICLKPLLLVSLTTSIAMVPVLLVGGIGNDLQNPMALVIIGGLTIGTFFTTWFIPLSFFYYLKLRKFLNLGKSNNE